MRDASYVEHNLCGLVITEDNLEHSLQTVNNDSVQDGNEARKLQKCIDPARAWCSTTETLDETELLWTGNSREHGNLSSPFELYAVCVTLDSGLARRGFGSRSRSPRGIRWKPVKPLSYVAISFDALAAVQEKANSTKSTATSSTGRNAKPLWSLSIGSGKQQWDKERIIDLYRPVRYTPVRHSLAAAIHASQMVTSNHSGSSTGSRNLLGTPTDPVWVQTGQKRLTDMPKQFENA